MESSSRSLQDSFVYPAIKNASSLSEILAEQIDLEILIRYRELRDIEEQIEKAEVILSIISQSNKCFTLKTPVRARYKTSSPFTPPNSDSPIELDNSDQLSVLQSRFVKEKHGLFCPRCRCKNFRDSNSLISHYRKFHKDNSLSLHIPHNYLGDDHSQLSILSNMQPGTRVSLNTAPDINLHTRVGKEKFPQFLKSFLEKRSYDIDITSIYKDVTEPVKPCKSQSNSFTPDSSCKSHSALRTGRRKGHVALLHHQTSSKKLASRRTTFLPVVSATQSHLANWTSPCMGPGSKTLASLYRSRRTTKSTAGLLERTVLLKSRFSQKLRLATVNEADLSSGP